MSQLKLLRLLRRDRVVDGNFVVVTSAWMPHSL
jgi:hypothetical protein